MTAMTQVPSNTNSDTLARAYVSLRRSNNDLRIVAGKDTASSSFTLLSLLKNEFYFLPAFLSHYRRLGVQRFIFLNDNSNDGSVEYLLDQPDTILVESDHSYGDPVSTPSSLSKIPRNLRMMVLWRSIMHDMFADERWALQVDIDEFVHLPAGATFQDVVARLERENVTEAWGVMLDVYPPTIHDLRHLAHQDQLQENLLWYFDGEQHLKLRKGQRPKLLHPGARARLYHTHKITHLYRQLEVARPRPIHNLLRNMGITRRPPRYNALWKPVLLRWSTRNNTYFLNSHGTNLIASRALLLPIQHFRFSGAIYRKISTNVHERSHYNNSGDYRLLDELLRHMELNDSTFMYSMSRPMSTFHDLTSTGNAIGL